MQNVTPDWLVSTKQEAFDRAVMEIRKNGNCLTRHLYRVNGCRCAIGACLSSGALDRIVEENMAKETIFRIVINQVVSEPPTAIGLSFLRALQEVNDETADHNWIRNFRRFAEDHGLNTEKLP
jgi:hypothetical protein